MRRFLSSLILIFLATVAAAAQSVQPFSPTATPVTLAVTASSARVALPSTSPTALIVNTGSNAAYIVLGNSSVVATTSNLLLNPGCPFAHNSSGQTYLAAITATSTTTLSISTGSGLPTLPNSGCVISGVISGTVTANQGTAGANAWPVKIDQTTPGTTNGVVVNSGTVSVGGEFQQSATLTVAASSHAANQCLGPTQSFTVTTLANGGVILDNVSLRWQTGLTSPVAFYIFNAQPTACDDGATFALSAADDDKRPPGGYFVITPSTMQGVTQTSGVYNNMAMHMKADAAGKIWIQAVTTATVSPGSVGDPHVSINGMWDNTAGL